ncbi:MAG: hypothetical protein ACE5KJ_05595 [Candidatus Zixiibacteriota bacterium]
MLGGIGLQELVLLFLIFLIWAIILIPYWKIFGKAGFPGWYSLSQIIPILNIIALYFLAFAKWPIYSKLDEMKHNSDSGGA